MTNDKDRYQADYSNFRSVTLKEKENCVALRRRFRATGWVGVMKRTAQPVRKVLLMLMLP